MRPIDADAFFENLTGYAAPEMVWDAGDIEHKLDEMPTIAIDDPRPKGEWIEKMDGFWKKKILICSACGTRNALGYAFNYCPNCGAKMEAANET